MHRIYTASQAVAIDKYSIEKVGIPSLVLMERAGLAVTDTVTDLLETMPGKTGKVLCVCGHGNNGADGLTVARQLNEKGVNADVYIAGYPDKGTEEFKLQLSVVKNLGIDTLKDCCLSKYDVIVDGIFGNGLEREVSGMYAKLIAEINGSGIPVVAIDVPSGTDATTGKTLGISIKAEKTVTFGKEKTGLVFFPGATNAGEVLVYDIGFAPEAEKNSLIAGENVFFLLDDEEIKHIPKRFTDTHKGSYGKVMIAAGSLAYGGAAVLCAKAALRTGAGIVKVYTHEENRDVLIAAVPEAIPVVYDDAEDKDDFENCLKRLAEEAGKADVVVLGPGLDTDEAAHRITETVLKNVKGILIADADCLNVVSEINKRKSRGSSSIAKKAAAVIITPHIGEMARLLDKNTEEIKDDPVDAAATAASKYGCTTVLKSARTVIKGDGESYYVNAKGNPGMATAGSGDVLTGIIAGLAAMAVKNEDDRSAETIKEISQRVAYTGVFLHARAGDLAAAEKGEHSLMASDIIEKVSEVLRNA